MNILVLSLTCLFCKSAIGYRKLRMTLAAVSGTGMEAFVLLFFPYVFSILCVAIVIVPLMLVFAFGWENKKQRMVRILSSWLSIVLLNGVSTAVYNLTGLQNLYLYTALVTAGIASVLVKNLVMSVQRQKKQMPVVIYNGSASVSCMGLLDSGNLLTMPQSTEPVQIADEALLQKIVNENTLQKKITYRALGNSAGELNVYCVDGMRVEIGPDQFRSWNPVWIGCAQQGLLHDRTYQMILHASVLDAHGSSRRQKFCNCLKNILQ